jgi:hypothetical protein
MQLSRLIQNILIDHFFEVFAMFHHHSSMDRVAEEVFDDHPAPQPQPIDAVSAPLDASARAIIFSFNDLRT